MIKQYSAWNYLNKTLDVFEASSDQALESSVKAILNEVKTYKDQALFKYTSMFDKVNLSSLKVAEDVIEKAFIQLEDHVKKALLKAIKHITLYHEKQTIPSFEYEFEGRRIGQKVTPIQAVGVYIPGGTATYPSTVLMNVIPAKIAGVKDIYIITPPNKDGKVDQTILAAAFMLNIKDIFMVGGAQGIAALAYGTETIPKVDKIVGPGNRYVACAKRLLSGIVGIDTIAGPSEVLILADKDANPIYIAADMLAQAEHDTFAKAICVSDSKEILDRVSLEIERQLLLLSRESIARQSIDSYGACIFVSSINEGIDIVNTIAPEHLELHTKDNNHILSQIKHAGAIFLGNYTPEPVGDYMAGPNHTLPTSGVSRFSSGLSTYDFLKRTSYVEYSKEAFLEDAKDIISIAEEEGLSAHAQSIKVRV
jgi:histidinol dehydrogenase